MFTTRLEVAIGGHNREAVVPFQNLILNRGVERRVVVLKRK